MFHRANARARLAACVALLLCAASVAAQEPPQEGKGATLLSPSECKRLHERGWALYAANECEAAEKVWTQVHGPDDWRVRSVRESQSFLLTCQKVIDSKAKFQRLMEATELTKQASEACARQDYQVVIVRGPAAQDALRALGLEDTYLCRGVTTQLATAHQELSHFAEAEKLWKEVVAGADKGIDPERAHALSRLGTVYLEQGEYAKAVPWLEEADGVFAQLVKDEFFLTDGGGQFYRSYGMHLSSRGLLCQQTGDYAKAADLFGQSAAVYERLPQLETSLTDYAAALVNQTNVFLKTPSAHPVVHKDDLARVRRLLRQAADRLSRAAGKKRQEWLVRVLTTLAYVHEHSLDSAGHDAVLQEALAAVEKGGLQNTPVHAVLLNNSHIVYLSNGRVEEAEAALRRAVGLSKELFGARSELYKGAVSNLAFVLRLRGEILAAHRLEEELLSSSLEDAKGLFALQSERQRLALAGQLGTQVSAYLDSALACQADAGAVYGRVAGYKGMAAFKKAEEEALRGHPELRELFKKRVNLRAELTAVWSRIATGSQGAGDDARALKDKVDRLDEIERAIAAKSALFRDYQDRWAVRPEEVAAALPPGAVFIDLFPCLHHGLRPRPDPTLPYPANVTDVAPSYVAFVIRNNQPVRMVLLSDSVDWIDMHVERWLQAVLSREEAKVQEEGRKLARLVWEPLAAHVGGASTVIVCPAGGLARLPLGALPGSRAGTYLLDEVPINYVRSARQLLDAARGPADGAAPASLLAVGGIAYGTAAPQETRNAPQPGALPQEFGPLPGSSREVEEVLGRFRAAYQEGGRRDELLKGTQATKGRLRDEFGPAGPGWGFFHFSGHGFFAEAKIAAATPAARGDNLKVLEGAVSNNWLVDELTTALCSGIAVSGAEGAAGGGTIDESRYFTADEVGDLELRGTELVVLSACESGNGKERGGEAAVGLQRAFHQAGARRVLASLWRVDDETGRRMMRQFYANLWEKGLGPQEALRQAQIEVRDHGPGDSDRPYYWANWVLSGDWRDIPRPAASARGGADETENTAGGGSIIPAAVAVGAACLGLIAGVIVWRRLQAHRAGPAEGLALPALAPAAPDDTADEQYFYSQGKRKIGPVSLARLRQLVSAGELRPTDMVHRPGTQKWVPVAAVLGVEAGGQQTPHPG
jgi:CHAT domain-containing protein/tetratricopeptide (TPR) repeat protein